MKKLGLLFAVAVMCFGCSGSNSDNKGDSLEDKLLTRQDSNSVTFSISGNATCSVCQNDGAEIKAMQIEIFTSQRALESSYLGMYDGVGPFSAPRVIATPGQVLEIHGKLMREGASGYASSYYGYAEVTAPMNDGDVVGVTLKFPSDDSE